MRVLVFILIFNNLNFIRLAIRMLRLLSKLLSLLKSVREIFSAILRDLLGLWLVFTIETKLKRLENTGKVLDNMFDRWAREQPEKPCIIFNDSVWTFHDVITLLGIFFFKSKKTNLIFLLRCEFIVIEYRIYLLTGLS